MNDRKSEKLTILPGAAKHEVSCATNRIKRKRLRKGLGNAPAMGICHSYTEDGLCVALLEVLMTNCRICEGTDSICRKSNAIARSAFTVQEVVDLTISFYRRNYVEGLLLNSDLVSDVDYSTERMIRVAKLLRTVHRFNGYIHLKLISGSNPELLKEAGLYADRISVSPEPPTGQNLRNITSGTNHLQVYGSINYLNQEILQNYEEPGGQSTQVVVGATSKNDQTIKHLASELYQKQRLRRAYNSSYIPIATENRLSPLSTPPLCFEYGPQQIATDDLHAPKNIDHRPSNSDLEIDPKLAYALRNPGLFPIDVNQADYELLLKVPGIDCQSAKMIVKARTHKTIKISHLKRMGVALHRAQYFIQLSGNPYTRGNTASAPISTVRPAKTRRKDLSANCANVVQQKLFYHENRLQV